MLQHLFYQNQRKEFQRRRQRQTILLHGWSRNASSSVKRMVVNDAAKQTNIKYMNRNVGQFFAHTQTFAASNAYTFFIFSKIKT